TRHRRRGSRNGARPRRSRLDRTPAAARRSPLCRVGDGHPHSGRRSRRRRGAGDSVFEERAADVDAWPYCLLIDHIPVPQPPLLTVSQLTRQIKDAVEGNFPIVWVQGEVTNCTRAGSGHVYLSLKDESAQIRAVIWRNTAARLKFELRDGLEVVAAGP